MTALVKLGLGIVALFVVVGIVVAAVDPTSPVVENTTEERAMEAEPVEGVQEPQVAAATDELVAVTDVVDGDTFKIEGSTVRLIGVDTPETVHPSQPVGCMGKEASDKTKELLEGKQVRLEKDVSETDHYGRQLRYVYLEDGTFVNELLVREGFASAASFPPDVKHQDLFRTAEQSARENKWGLWSDLCVSPTPPVVTIPPKVPVVNKPVQEVPAAPVQPAANCSSDSYNCGDFSSCAEVMEVFNACSADVHGLDRDDDGVPCEDLCE